MRRLGYTERSHDRPRRPRRAAEGRGPRDDDARRLRAPRPRVLRGRGPRRGHAAIDAWAAAGDGVVPRAWLRPPAVRSEPRRGAELAHDARRVPVLAVDRVVEAAHRLRR